MDWIDGIKKSETERPHSYLIDSNSVSCFLLAQTKTKKKIMSHVFKTGISRWARHRASCFASACRTFCHRAGLAGVCTQSDQPSHMTAPVNRGKMQVFHDIAAVTVQLIDWCCSCCNGITRPVEFEIHACAPCRWCFIAVWTIEFVKPYNLYMQYLQQSSQKVRITLAENGKTTKGFSV